MAPFEISRDECALVTKVIVDLGNQNALQGILMAANAHTVDVVASQALNLGEMATKLIAFYCKDPPRFLNFLHAFCSQRPGIEELEGLQALAARVEEHTRMAPVVVMLNRLGEATDPALRQLVSEARSGLLRVGQRLVMLTTCKEIHDRLHALQTQSYEELQRAAFSAGELDEAERQNIQLQARRIEDFMDDTRLLLGALARAPSGIGDPDWLDEVAVLLELLRSVTQREPARNAVYILRGILRRELPRFDGAIIAIADTIPFHEPVELVRKAAQLPGAPAGTLSVADAAASRLEQVAEELQDMIALHRKWQDIDAKIWEMEQQLTIVSAYQLPSQTGGEWSHMDFLWGSIRERLAAMRTQAPEYWPPDLDQALDAVATAALQDRATQAGALPSAIRALRLAFVGIDKALKSQCIRISALREPILALVETDDGD